MQEVVRATISGMYLQCIYTTVKIATVRVDRSESDALRRLLGGLCINRTIRVNLVQIARNGEQTAPSSAGVVSTQGSLSAPTRWPLRSDLARNTYSIRGRRRTVPHSQKVLLVVWTASNDELQPVSIVARFLAV